MSVLLQSRRGGKGFAALRTGVRSSTNVVRPDMPLEVAWIGEDLRAILAVILSGFAVLHGSVFEQIGPKRVGLGTQIAAIFVPSIVVFRNQMFVAPKRNLLFTSVCFGVSECSNQLSGTSIIHHTKL